MDTKFVQTHYPKWEEDMSPHLVQTEKNIQVELADGTASPIKALLQQVPLSVQQYAEKLECMHVINIQKYDAILGKPWLFDHNPKID